MTEYEKMREDGYNPASYDRERLQKTGKLDIFTHPDDPNFVRIQGTNSWEKYDSSKHDVDK